MTLHKNELLFFTPVFKEMIWGGNKLQTEFNYDIPSEKTGECWAISAHPNGDCTVKNHSTYAGKTLSSLWQNQRELFGGMGGEKFPLLVKLIDAKQDLSIQVHPDDAYASVNEKGSFGKTECWYVLNCDEGADIVIGHNAADKEAMQDMILQKEWDKLIRKFPVHKDAFFQITPGTIHAIKAGTMILEIQQNSDITYRVYDYDRLSNGVLRELHIQKSLDVIKTPYVPEAQGRKKITYSTYIQEQLVQCRYYNVDKIKIQEKTTFNFNLPFMICSVIEGAGNIDAYPIQKGDHFIIPNGYGDYQIEGSNLTLIRATV